VAVDIYISAFDKTKIQDTVSGAMSKYVNLQDQEYEERLFLHRVIWMLVFVAIVIAVLIRGLYKLQVVEYSEHATKSKKNQYVIEPVPPTRGLIYDRNQNLLAGNVPTHTLEITPEQACQTRKTRSNCMKKLLRVLDGLITINEKDWRKFHKAYSKNRRYAKGFQSIPIRYNLTTSEVAVLAAQRYRLPGIHIKASQKRYYPYANSLSHVIGYVRRVDQTIIDRWTPEQKINYKGTAFVGVKGIEKQYENILHGVKGNQRNERNVFGRVISSKLIKPSVPGKSIYLTIDKRLQEVAENALGAKAGAVVAIDPNSGEVLALVSKPGYDPNQFVSGISSQQFQQLQLNKARPLYPRALKGTFAPGSTIKPFYALGALYYDLTHGKKMFSCGGTFRIPGARHTWHDWKRGGHGTLNLAKAVRRSCDIYFYDLSAKMKIDRISEFLTLFGFGQPTGIDMPRERLGVLPSRAYKIKQHKRKPRTPNMSNLQWRQYKALVRQRQKWYLGDTISVGIGQGLFTSTPLQLASATATMANRGKLVIPHLLRAVRPSGSKDLYYLTPEVENSAIKEYKIDKKFLAEVKRRRKVLGLIKPEHWDYVHQSMVDVVHAPGGTARRLIPLAKKEFEFAGKTGTAQVVKIKKGDHWSKKKVPEHLKDNALFVVFAPADKPKIAVAVIVINGGHGGAAAAPIAGKLIRTYMDILNQQNKPAGENNSNDTLLTKDTPDPSTLTVKNLLKRPVVNSKVLKPRVPNNLRKSNPRINKKIKQPAITRSNTSNTTAVTSTTNNVNIDSGTTSSNTHGGTNVKKPVARKKAQKARAMTRARARARLREIDLEKKMQKQKQNQKQKKNDEIRIIETPKPR